MFPTAHTLSSFVRRVLLLATATALLTTSLTGPATAGGTPAAPVLTAASPTTTAACRSIPTDRSLQVTRTVHDVGRSLGVSAKVMLAGFEAGWVESHMNNLRCGDRDSLGVFQQRPSQGWGEPAQILDVSYAATRFFSAAKARERSCAGCTAGQLAQVVQRSAFPLRYDQSEGVARELLQEVAGGNDATLNPFKAAEVCGTGFRLIDQQKLGTVGAVFLLWDGRTKRNCVVALKTKSVGTATPMSASLKPDGTSSTVDSGKFGFYAGPVTRPAPRCLSWGGSIGTQRYTSPREHCGS
jgi:hypothetical protein